MIGLSLEFSGRKRRRFVEIGKINDMTCYMRENKTEYYDRVFVDIGNKNMYFVCYKDRIGVLKDYTKHEIIEHAKEHIVNNSKTKDCKINLGVAEFFNVRDQAEMHNAEVSAFIEEKEMREYEEKKRKEEEMEKQKAIEWEKQLDNAEERYRNGKLINAEEFKGLCKRYGINIPIKTLGAINRYVHYVYKDGIRFSGCKNSSLAGTHEINEKIARVLNYCYNEEEEEDENVADEELLKLLFRRL